MSLIPLDQSKAILHFQMFGLLKNDSMVVNPPINKKIIVKTLEKYEHFHY